MSSARFYGFGLVGAVMIGASIALVAYFAFGFGTTGSCSSTGYIDGRRVPVCSGEQIVGIVGIFPAVALGLAGLVVSGRRAPRFRRSGNLGLAVWTLGYLVVGGALIASTFDPASDAKGLDRIGWAIPGFIFIPLGLGGIVFGLVRRRKAAAVTRLLGSGTRGRATLVAVHDTGVTVNMNPRVTMELEIRPEGGIPYRASKTSVVSRLAIPRPGDELDVWIDPEDPQKFAVALPERPAAAAAATALVAAAAPVAAPVTDTAAPADGDAGLLERLTALRDAGVLSEAEFESAKGRIPAR